MVRNFRSTLHRYPTTVVHTSFRHCQNLASNPQKKHLPSGIFSVGGWAFALTGVCIWPRATSSSAAANGSIMVGFDLRTTPAGDAALVDRQLRELLLALVPVINSIIIARYAFGFRDSVGSCTNRHIHSCTRRESKTHTDTRAHRGTHTHQLRNTWRLFACFVCTFALSGYQQDTEQRSLSLFCFFSSCRLRLHAVSGK